MPPVISPTQNLLGFEQYQPWAFLPYADGLDNSTAVQWRTDANLARRLPDVVVARMSALPTCTYANGTDGIGATLTADSNGALGSVDGRSLVVGDAILVGAQAASAQNGIYEVSDLGSAGTPWVLTRHTAMDSASEFVGFALVLSGSSYGGKIYLAPPWAVTVGSSPVTWAEWKNRAIAVTSVPAGINLNIATGELTGAATKAGSGEIGIRMSADSGGTWSDPARIVYGIDAAEPPAQGGVELTIDLASNTVDVSGGVFAFAVGDQKLLRVRFRQGEQVLDKGTLSALQIGLKERDGEEPVILGGGKTGDGKSPPWFGKVDGEAVYLLYMQPEGDALQDVIDAAWRPKAGEPNYVLLDVVIRWTEDNLSGVGPSTLSSSTIPFTARAYAEIPTEA